MSAAFPVSIHIGAIVESNGKQYCIRRLLSLSHFEAVDVQTGRLQMLKLSDIQKSSVLDMPSQRIDLITLKDEDWKIALDRYQVIQPLIGIHRTKTDVQKIAVIAQVNPATIYRWLARFEDTGTVSSLMRKPRNDVGRSRIASSVESIMADVIQNYYLTKHRVSITISYRELQRLCRLEGESAPDLSTFRRRIAAISPETHHRHRHPNSKSTKKALTKGPFPGADFPFAVLQIDHTLVDIILVDEEHRLPIGRPYITIAIDVNSRMVAGYYISFDPPGTLGTGLCISNAVLDKDKRLKELGLQFEWPCKGLPVAIHVDNAKEFRGNTLKKACQEYGINLIFRPVKRPNYGGHIERLMGTFLSEIHAVPGSTKSNPKARDGIDAEKESIMTLEEFERWFANLALGHYHYRNHNELNMSPISKFMEGIHGGDDQPGTGMPMPPADEKKFRIDFLPFKMRTIQQYGIALDGIYYQGDILSRWIDVTDGKDKKKFIVRRDPRDISSILFYDPEIRRYFRLPYQNPSFPAISLWELKAIKRYLKAKGKQTENQDMIFTAFNEMRRIEESAKTLTKKARANREKKRLRKKAVDKGQHLKVQPTSESFLPADDIQPFDEVEDL